MPSKTDTVDDFIIDLTDEDLAEPDPIDIENEIQIENLVDNFDIFDEDVRSKLEKIEKVNDVQSKFDKLIKNNESSTNYYEMHNSFMHQNKDAYNDWE